jgi:DNA-binding MarR family transcriptional regulator
MDNSPLSSKQTFPPLLHLSYILQQLSDELLLDSVGVGLSQARIMSVLHQSIPRSQRAVATYLSQTEANVSRQLKIMKRQGLVSITKNKKDSRRRDVMLTATGARKYAQAEKLLKSQQSKFLKLLSTNELKAFERAAQNLGAQHRLH